MLLRFYFWILFTYITYTYIVYRYQSFPFLIWNCIMTMMKRLNRSFWMKNMKYDKMQKKNFLFWTVFTYISRDKLYSFTSKTVLFYGVEIESIASNWVQSVSACVIIDLCSFSTQRFCNTKQLNIAIYEQLKCWTINIICLNLGSR